LDELSPSTISNLEEGDSIEATLISKSFDPVLFLLNQNTGEVIDVEYNATSITIGADTFQSVDLSYTVPNNTDNYVLSVESASANQQGEYFLVGDYF
jgi:Ni,Fe-hydrogenase I small subunit